jgi:hypothetical protein
MLAEREAAKTLVRFMPILDPDESEIRELFMVSHLHRWLYQSDRKKTAKYKANIRGFLKRYVIGGNVDNEDYMKTWRADVFEFRVQLQPRREHTRIFGAFVKPDVFVAIHQKLRSYFKNKDDPRWDRAIDRVTSELATLFPGHTAMRSVPFSNCITSNVFDINL